MVYEFANISSKKLYTVTYQNIKVKCKSYQNVNLSKYQSNIIKVK